MTTLLIAGLGPGELIVILFVVLVVFGGAKLPQIGDALGRGVRGFRKALSGSSDAAPAVVPVAEPPADRPADRE